MQAIAAIDLGSTSLKAMIFDLDGRCLATASRPTEQTNPYAAAHPEWVFFDPEQIWGGAADACREAVAQLADPRSIRGVSITGMGMVGVPVAADGAVLYPFISWQDPRTGAQADLWERAIGAERTFAIAGLPPWAMTGAMRIRWLMEHEPAIIAQADKWLPIEDFVNFRLCGVMATDFSVATCTLLFDQRRRAWSDELVEAAGIPRRLLPDVKPSGTLLGAVCGAAAARTGLPAGTPVVLGGQDHICGTLPVGAWQPDVVLDIMGTWENLMTTVETPRLSWDLGSSGICMQAHVAPARYAAWCGSPSSSALEWFQRECAAGEGGDWTRLMDAARASRPGAGGVVFLPYLSAAVCPESDNCALGAFVGLSSTTTRGDLCRAVIEGLNYQFLDMARAMEAGLGTRFQRIIATGGATRNAFWVQNKADVAGLPVEVSEIQDASSLGVAMVAGVALGLYPSLDEARQRVKQPTRLCTPNLGLTARYAECFKIYKDLYPALRPACHRLHGMFKEEA